MNHGSLSAVEVLGTLAALCTTLAFIPQITKIRRQGGHDLSYRLLGVYLAGGLLWSGYGLLIDATEVIAANLVSAVLVATAILLKGRAERRRLPPVGRLRIAIDMDDVIADFRPKEERARAARRQASGTPVYEEPGFFADLDVIEGSQQVVRELAARHEVFIASAAMEVPMSFADKYSWLRRHFSFIPPSHYVFCGDKSVLDVDVLIDDMPRQLDRCRGRGLLFSAPHNAHEHRYERVASWAEVRRLLLPAPLTAPATGPASAPGAPPAVPGTPDARLEGLSVRDAASDR